MIQFICILPHEFRCYHVAVELKHSHCIGLWIPAIQRFKVSLQHQGYLLSENAQKFTRAYERAQIFIYFCSSLRGYLSEPAPEFLQQRRVLFYRLGPVDVQIPIDRQVGCQFPHIPQFFPGLPHRLLCPFLPYILHSAVKIHQTLIDQAQFFLLQIQNVHNALTDRIFSSSDKNTVIMEDHCKIVHSIQKNTLCVNYLVFHISPRLYPIDF